MAAAAGALGALLEGGLVEAGERADRSPLDDPLVAALPRQYAETLSVVNGFAVYHGFYRLFGLRSTPSLDLRAWNATAGWRFAWDGRADPFLCVGESAFGDQYAFRRADGGAGYGEEVYLLEANFLQPEVIAGDFEEFLAGEFLRNATEPYDEMAVEAVRRLGPVDVTRNLVYTPSIALGGPEDAANLMPLDAFTAMVIAGDLAMAIETADDDAVPRAIEPYTDESGRSRLRVRFEPADRA